LTFSVFPPIFSRSETRCVSFATIFSPVQKCYSDFLKIFLVTHDVHFGVVIYGRARRISI